MTVLTGLQYEVMDLSVTIATMTQFQSHLVPTYLPICLYAHSLFCSQLGCLSNLPTP